MNGRRLLAVLVCAAGCISGPEPDSDMAIQDAAANDAQAPGDSGYTTRDAGADATSPDMARVDAGADETLPADQYCELTATFFCDYYLRCGRTATTSVEGCEAVFVESCNAVFEPQYAALADAGKMRLSADGMAACEAHLSAVACEEQIFDLDGGCSQMWQGLSPEGAPCAPGIGSFVCGEGTACVLGLDFCGTCTAAVGVGADCSGPETCVEGARCVDGICVERGLPGATCSDEAPCAVGASCTAGVCEGPTVVGVGDSCDQARRCPYTSTCIGGTCVKDALIGESCAASQCASGRCVDGTCRPFIPVGGPCVEGGQCASGVCEAETCAQPVSMCFAGG